MFESLAQAERGEFQRKPGALGWLNLLRVKVNPQVDEARRKEVLRGVQRRARATQNFKRSSPEKPMMFGP